MIRAFNRRTRANRGRLTVAAVFMLTLWWSMPASAQLDPLLFMKRVPPTVIIVVDSSTRMMEDGDGYYYDPNTYTVAQDVAAASAMGINTALSTTYRRKYKNLQYENVQDAATKFEAEDIIPVVNSASSYASFYSATRLEMAKTGIDLAVSANSGSLYRWGLIKLRQTNAAWRISPNCDKPVRITGNASLSLASDAAPCNAGAAGKFGIYVPTVASANFANETQYGGGARVVTPGNGTSSSVLSFVRRAINDNNGLVPAGAGTRNYKDRPITHALEDARDAAIAAMSADTAAFRSCRNTVIVLITSGKDEGDNSYDSAHNPTATATQLRSMTVNGITKRFPVHVVAIKPVADDVAELQQIATNSGGIYRNVSSANQVAAAINYAVQSGFTRQTDFDTSASSEFLPVSPIVGTVNLKNGKSKTGGALPNTDIKANPGGQDLPQRSNFLLTTGFKLPSFDAVLRAFRVYVPVADATKPTGWTFTKDGTPLWPDIDGRPTMAGLARTPSDPNSRNIYTYIPNGSGGGSVVAFTTANEATLRPHLNDTSSTTATALISFIRAQPLGAVIGSTPAIMDVPSLDPPPDEDYGYDDNPASFAGKYKDRRALIYFGANDGMIHAVDARTGFEVWAFIPYNLLPKLRALQDGQGVDKFDYFVDSSPKIAEVKVNGTWRSLLFIGQGPGGTFYQAFDVSEAGMGVAPDQDGLGAVTSLLAQFDSPNESITFKWAFPNYSSFDPTYTASFTVNDGTPGNQVRMYGDLKSSATSAEKTVGFTWSDPAVGPLNFDRSVNAVIVGSGYFPDIEGSLPGRGNTAPKAGNAVYLLNPDTGTLLGNAASCTSVTSGSGSGLGCVSIGDAANPGGQRKNAIQADPTAAGEALSYVVNKAYVGDLDGKYWRFSFNSGGTLSVTQMVDTSQPIYASSALLFIGSSDVYMFFATGSDLLPSSSNGGTGAFRLYGLKDNNPAAGATVKFQRNLTSVSNSSGLATGERPSTSPSVAGDIVFYTTTSEDAATPCSDFTARLYGLTYVGGAAYDADKNGKIDNNETPVAATVAGRATAPFIVDQHLYFGSAGATGAMIEAFGDPDDFNNGVGQVGVRILSWREIR
jgi:hypothetical protein